MSARWIKIYPDKFSDSADMHEPNQFCVFLWLLFNATWKIKWDSWQGKRIQLEPGQLVFSVNEISNHYVGLSEKQIRLALSKLVTRETIRLEKGNRGFLLTFCNWSKYQIGEDLDGNTEVNQKEIKSKTKVNQKENRGFSPIYKKIEGKKDRIYAKEKTVDETSDEVCPVENSNSLFENPAKENIRLVECEIVESELENKLVQIKSETPQKPQKEARSAQAWEGYRQAYISRYRVEPVRAKLTNKWLCDFCEVVPKEDQSAVASFYVMHQDQWYVRMGHDPKWLAQNAAKIYTEWRTGRIVNSHSARQGEMAAAGLDTLKRYQERQRLKKEKEENERMINAQ